MVSCSKQPAFLFHEHSPESKRLKSRSTRTRRRSRKSESDCTQSSSSSSSSGYKSTDDGRRTEQNPEQEEVEMTAAVLSENNTLLKDCPWYAPELDYAAARSFLRELSPPPGSFLLRPSGHNDFLYSFTIRVRRSRPSTSVRVVFKDGYFALDAARPVQAPRMPRFTSIHELVEYYATENRRRPDAERCYYTVSSSSSNKRVIELLKPVVARLPKLQHLCRIAWNRANGQQRLANNTLPVPVSPAIKSYLREYPYTF